MTYHNPFGGFWVSTPFNDSARAQNWTPALDQDWDYANDRMYGVNLYVSSSRIGSGRES
jgi:glucan 1,3-beta-glucosidase